MKTIMRAGSQKKKQKNLRPHHSLCYNWLQGFCANLDQHLGMWQGDLIICLVQAACLILWSSEETIINTIWLQLVI